MLRSRLRRNAGKVTTAHGPQSRTHVCCRGLLVGARNLLHCSQNILILPYSIVFISQPRHAPLSSNYLYKTAIADKFFFWSAWGRHIKPYPSRGTVAVPLRTRGLYQFDSLLSLIQRDCRLRSAAVSRNAGGTSKVNLVTQDLLGRTIKIQDRVPFKVGNNVPSGFFPGVSALD